MTGRRFHDPQRCPDCNGIVATLVPWHGDGSVVRFVAHGPVGDRCSGSREIPPGYFWTRWPGLPGLHLLDDGEACPAVPYDVKGRPMLTGHRQLADRWAAWLAAHPGPRRTLGERWAAFLAAEDARAAPSDDQVVATLVHGTPDPAVDALVDRLAGPGR